MGFPVPFRILNAQLRASIFAARRFLDLASQLVRNPLHPVANPEYGNSQRQHFWIALRRLWVIDGAWTAGQNDSRRRKLADFFNRRRARQDGGKNLLLANPARNELGVLSAEVENHHAPEFRLHPASLLSRLYRRLFCRALHHAIPLTPRRDSITCPARICASRQLCLPDAEQSTRPFAPAFQLGLRWPLRRLSLCHAAAHSPALVFRLRPRPSTLHQTPASLPSTIRRCVPAFPKALPRDAASSAPALASAVPALPCELPAALLFPVAP